MISIASYAIAMLKYFPNVLVSEITHCQIENQCQFYSFWMGFGSISCIAAVAQFEGYGQFFGRLFEKRILPLSLCFCLSLCELLESLVHTSWLHFFRTSKSVFCECYQFDYSGKDREGGHETQCLCLVILFSLYTSTPFTFFLSNNTTAVRLALGPFAVQKAKD